MDEDQKNPTLPPLPASARLELEIGAIENLLDAVKQLRDARVRRDPLEIPADRVINALYALEAAGS